MVATEVTRPVGSRHRGSRRPAGVRAASGEPAAGEPRAAYAATGKPRAAYAAAAEPRAAYAAAAEPRAGYAAGGEADGAVPFGMFAGMGRGQLLGCAAALVEQLGGDEAALVEVAGKAVARLGCEALGGSTSDEALAASIEGLYRLETQVAAEKTRRMGEASRRAAEHADARRGERDGGGRGAGGGGSAEELWQEQLGLTPGQARTAARTARGLERLPRTAALFRDGLISAEHAKAVAADALEIPEQAWEELDELVADHARDCNLTQLRRLLTEFRAVLDERYLVDKEQAAFARRKAWVGARQRDGSTKGGFSLDPVGAATVKAALAALARPTGADDDRTREQRMADALVKLCERSLDAGDLPEVAAQRPHVIVTSSVEALEGVPGADPAHLDGVGPVSSATARMLACDGEVTEIVVDERGRPLQCKQTRKPTGKQRLAVIARDGGCIGCGAPASWCQTHHIVWSSNGGATVVENLVLVCLRCHRKIHHAGWQVVRKNGRYALKTPEGLVRSAGRRRTP